jgi:hypothetical protein
MCDHSVGIDLCETRPSFCTTSSTFVYILMDPDPNWKACHQHIWLATNMKFAVVNIYGRPNIWCEDQHRLTTKKFFYLELKRNLQFYRPCGFSRTNHNPSSRAPYDKRKQLWKNFCIKVIWQSHHTHCHFNTTSDNIPLIDSNTHDYAMAVLSLVDGTIHIWKKYLIWKFIKTKSFPWMSA